jgi:hypothetical protein
LSDAGIAFEPGDETSGIHRRHFDRPLAELAARAFAHRSLTPPSLSAIERAEGRAEADLARMRRLSVPRSMLARILELALIYDRATLLEESSDRLPIVAQAFARDASPRNVAILREPSSHRDALA